MNHVFITGLPRSRTAWFANFLTYGNAFVMHDGFRDVESMDDFHSKLEGSDGRHEIRGNSDPCNVLFWEELNERYPKAKWVVIERHIEDVENSCLKVFPGMVRHLSGIQDRLEKLISKINPLIVQFEPINANIANHVADYCGIEWQSERTEMLLHMNVQIDPDFLIRKLTSSKPIPQFLRTAFA